MEQNGLLIPSASKVIRPATDKKEIKVITNFDEINIEEYTKLGREAANLTNGNILLMQIVSVRPIDVKDAIQGQEVGHWPHACILAGYNISDSHKDYELIKNSLNKSVVINSSGRNSGIDIFVKDIDSPASLIKKLSMDSAIAVGVSAADMADRKKRSNDSTMVEHARRQFEAMNKKEQLFSGLEFNTEIYIAKFSIIDPYVIKGYYNDVIYTPRPDKVSGHKHFANAISAD